MRQGLTFGSASWIMGGIILVPLFAFWAGKLFMHFVYCVCVCVCMCAVYVCVYILVFLDHYCCTLCTVMSHDMLILLCTYHLVV